MVQEGTEMFQGFSPESLDFLWGIRFNNEKSWFEAHKQDYLERVSNPLRALGNEVWEQLNETHPDLSLRCHVSRIYRDARRLHGRGPYKDQLWFSLRRSDQEQEGTSPVLWFEIRPEGFSYGFGYYAATPRTMAKFRARIDRDPKPMEKLARRLAGQKEFFLEGEEYKRSKGDPDPLLAPWYNRKELSLTCDRGTDPILYTAGLRDLLLDRFTWLLPFYTYFTSLSADPDPSEFFRT